jgi:hypothetical protein
MNEELLDREPQMTLANAFPSEDELLEICEVQEEEEKFALGQTLTDETEITFRSGERQESLVEANASGRHHQCENDAGIETI